MLEARIALLSDKHLPTQKQFDWRVEDPINISSIKQKRQM